MTYYRKEYFWPGSLSNKNVLNSDIAFSDKTKINSKNVILYQI